MPLSKTNNLGRKRRHPRIEELVRLNIRELVTQGGCAFMDRAGNKLKFSPEMDGHRMTLAVFINNRHQGDYQIVERSIPGWIKNKIDPDRMYFYYVVIDGRRFKSLYVDVQRQMIGSRLSLGAFYTSQSVSGRLEQTWRECRKLWKEKAWKWKR